MGWALALLTKNAAQCLDKLRGVVVRAKVWALSTREVLEQGFTYKIGVGTGSVPEMKSLRLKVGIGSQIVNDDAKFPHLVDVAAHPVHRMASVSRRRRPIHTRR